MNKINKSVIIIISNIILFPIYAFIISHKCPIWIVLALIFIVGILLPILLLCSAIREDKEAWKQFTLEYSFLFRQGGIFPLMSGVILSSITAWMYLGTAYFTNQPVAIS